MVYELFLVLFDLPVEFIDKSVNSSVHIVFSCISVYPATIHAYRRFRLVSQFLNRQDAVHI